MIVCAVAPAHGKGQLIEETQKEQKATKVVIFSW